MTKTQFELTAYLAEQVRVVDEALEKWVPAESTDPASIHKAMRYSLFAGGKRIRPILAMAAGRAVSDSPDGIENAAATLELIHTRLFTTICQRWIMTTCAAAGPLVTKCLGKLWRFWPEIRCLRLRSRY